jgi:hypothetical protein
MPAGVKVHSWGMAGPVASRPPIVHEGDYLGQRYLAQDEDITYISDGDSWAAVGTTEQVIPLADGSVTPAKLAALAVETAKIAAGAVTADQIGAGAVTKGKLAGGFLKSVAQAGQDETGDATIDVTGIAVGDELIGFFTVDFAGGGNGIFTRALTDFTISANVLTVVANAADESTNFYLIFWLDLT